MRKLGLLLIVVAALALVPAASFGAITGSAHDFSGATWNTSGQICITCHTPHNALSQLVPLWNHATTTATFTLYASSSLNAAPGQPAGVSKACLSCHDGTVALDSYGSATGSTNITGTALLGTNLSNDHPVSFLYDAALATADGGLVTPASAAAVVTGAPGIMIPLYGGNLECGSCHDVHNNAVPGDSNLLRKANAGSALCLTCHAK